MVSMPATQLPKLFSDQNNGVLVANSIPDRVKLVRTLKVGVAAESRQIYLLISFKAMGATITRDPKLAPFILVDANTYIGRKYLREWGHRPTAPILNYTWVRRCIEAGRLLTGPDNWGHCIAVDDGQNLEESADDDIPYMTTYVARVI